MRPRLPGRAESNGFEYKRNGALRLFAAQRTSERFVRFVDD